MCSHITANVTDTVVRTCIQ